jgi:hypothetical protein
LVKVLNVEAHSPGIVRSQRRHAEQFMPQESYCSRYIYLLQSTSAELDPNRLVVRDLSPECMLNWRWYIYHRQFALSRAIACHFSHLHSI